jgi:hypothetical protein
MAAVLAKKSVMMETTTVTMVALLTVRLKLDMHAQRVVKRVSVQSTRPPKRQQQLLMMRGMLLMNHKLN